MNVFVKYTVCCLFLLQAFFSISTEAQGLKWLKTKNDTAYISDHSRDLTVRLYGSRKYTDYKLHDRGEQHALKYKPNNNINVGVGFNYRFLGINLGFNLPFINNDNDRYGRTKHLDLQSHLYLRKITVDFYAQYYKGYYLANASDVLNDYNTQPEYPRRPDMHSLNLGIDMQYIFNDRKFSFRAAFLQNEYQKKSAGSFMLGASVYSFFLRADSSIIPADIYKNAFFDQYRFSKSNVYSIAVGGGYAYTFVLGKHFFITGSLMGEAGINYTTMDGTEQKNKADLQLNTIVRCAAGYNSERYFAGIHFVDLVTRNNTPVPAAYQEFGAGNFRVSFAKRFGVKRKTARKIQQTINQVAPVPLPRN
ncbi:DUF4421 domain-containing protein [Chitinophagaceae bacterium MMS25-I14]